MKRCLSKTGFALLETALMLPLLSIMLIGIYAFGNTLTVLSMAESESHAETLRVARKQTSSATGWNDLFPAGEKGLESHSSEGSGARILPSPLPNLAARAKVTVSIDRDWDIWTRSYLGIKSQKVGRNAELSGDCWDAGTASGKKVRAVVIALAVSGAL